MARFLTVIRAWGLGALLTWAPLAVLAQPPKPAYVTGSPTTGAIAKASGPQSFTTADLSGDCTTSASLVTICLKTNGVSFGAFATGTDAANLTGTLSASRIALASLSLSKIANASANSKLLGSGASGSGAAYAEIALGTGLTMTGTTLSASGSGGTVTTTGSPASGNLAKFSGSTSITSADISGDCTTAGTLAISCTKTGGTNFGTFATQNYATPPAIGGTTPAAGAFTTLSATGNTTTNITGSTQCVQASSAGVLSGFGSGCGGGGGVTSYKAQASSGTVNFKNNPTPATIIQPATVTIAASAVARDFLVTIYYATNTGGVSTPGVQIVLDSSSFPAGYIRLQPILDGNYGFGIAGGYSAYVAIPGDSATHVIGLGCAQFGSGSGFSVTTLLAQIIAVQID